MLHDWGVIAAAFGYIGFLFLVASYGNRLPAEQRSGLSALIYPLSLAIYCTSWTFFGSVGFATRNSVDFLAIYVGPILMIGFCTPLLRRVIKLAKSQNITSIADLIGARYGKSQAVAAIVALIAIIGSVPYIALQLKAVASSLETILTEDQAFSRMPLVGDIALLVTLAMATFAVLFGTRQTDATEHQHGLMLAVATESIVKLVAFIAAGAFVTFWMFSPVELIERAMKSPEGERALEYVPGIGNFLTMTLLSFCAAMLLPRQFHVSVVENADETEVTRARWLFPLYLVAINLFVIPIALAGLDHLPVRRRRQRHVRAGAADRGQRADPVDHRVRRRPVGGDRHGDRRMRRALDHGLQRHRDAAGAAAPAGGTRERQGFRRFPARHPPHRDLRHHGDGLSLLSRARQCPARRDRAAVLCGDRPACARVLRRPVLAPRHCPRRHRRHGGWLCRVALHAVHSEFPRHLDIGHSAVAAWPARHRTAAAAGAARHRPAAAAARSAVESLAQHPGLCLAVAGTRAVLDRAVAGRPVRSQHADADRAELPPLALHRDGAGYPDHGGAISRPRSRTRFVRGLRRQPPRAARSRSASRFRTAASRRAPDRLLDRRRLLAAGDVAAVAPAHRLGQGRAEAARRFPRRAALQPRDPADRAQSCAAGHRRVRCRSAADLLQPAIRRIAAAASAPDADRQPAARDPRIYGFDRALRVSRTARRCWRGGLPPTPPKANPIWSACPTATW